MNLSHAFAVLAARQGGATLDSLKRRFAAHLLRQTARAWKAEAAGSSNAALRRENIRDAAVFVRAALALEAGQDAAAVALLRHLPVPVIFDVPIFVFDVLGMSTGGTTPALKRERAQFHRWRKRQ